MAMKIEDLTSASTCTAPPSLLSREDPGIVRGAPPRRI
jgi:hypothetical protein